MREIAVPKSTLGYDGLLTRAGLCDVLMVFSALLYTRTISSKATSVKFIYLLLSPVVASSEFEW